ncbi:DUF4974 domain-containing protein [Chitinophaga silvatica]|uniref:DUF4974 domain-containing protein n=1 Tax=Chitinophaga silvatica TaxID=2282649 RepID=A0A3E1YDW7_9BACT|nr:FecR domain-containing protein [Chitinophaga silvatica]RFS24701.1 DUF4974 domain-containing protein [Chitinophaga silvatica]
MERQKNPKAAALLDKFHAGKCTPEELELLSKWYENIDSAENNPIDQQLSDTYQQQFLQNFRQQIQKPQHTKFRMWRWAAAAAILTGIGICSALLLNNNSLDNSAYVIITNTDKSPKIITLPDSSTVWLNTASTIRYKKDFSMQQRRLQLAGEAYFNINGNESNPFIVRTRDIDISVLGTQFNVEAYAAEGLTRVALSQGKVKVQSLKDKTINTILKPGYAASYINEGQALNISAVNISQITSWKEDAFGANDISFKDAIGRLCTHHGYTVKWQTTDNINKHINVLFEHSDFETVLKNLCYITRKNYRITDNQVTIF